MPHRRSAQLASRREKLFASAAAAASVVFSGALVLGQAPPVRNIVYSSQVEAPIGTTVADYLPPPTELDLRDAFAMASRVSALAAGEAGNAVPPVPWNRWGLARTEIDLENMRLDEQRGAYVVDLDDGRVAILTLDVELQQQLTRVASRYEEPGEAMVAVEPTTGRVLALVSDSSHSAVGSHLATRAYAWAASTFKVITGAALLAERVATTSTETCYSGGSASTPDLTNIVPSANDSNCVSLTTAMATSANIVFARLADQHLTPQTLQEYAEHFGYNTRIPFEANLERSTADLPEGRVAFAQAAAGFRYTVLSPLHGALISAAISNDGEMMVPALVARIEDGSGAVVYEHTPVVWRRVVSAEVANALRVSQSTTCESGTARSYFMQRDGFPADIRAWGKTGTLSNRRIDGSAPEHLFNNTWFIGAAERNGREIAVAALVVNTDTWWVKGGFLASETVLAALAE